MKHRRFGKTELRMPVFSLGGMQFPDGWAKDFNFTALEREKKDLTQSIVDRALEIGVNHIETARAYQNSEEWLGWALRDVPREDYILQSKVVPKDDPAAFERDLETTFRFLKTDHLDLCSVHGINVREEFDRTFRPGGCMEVVRRWQRDGRIRFVGFSTHGACDMIAETIETGEFDYVNLHWYFIHQANWPAVEAAAGRDMGVLIISPSDKGGQLYQPPAKLADHCRPLHPMVFNDLFCLRRPEVHTLSVGAGHPDHFGAHLQALDYYEKIDETIRSIEERIHAEMTRALGADWWPDYHRGLPDWDESPGGINLRYILRLWSWAEGMDLVDYGRYRYGMLLSGDGGTWMAGNPAEKIDDAAILEAVGDHPCRERIPGILREAHEKFSSGKPRAPLTSS